MFAAPNIHLLSRPAKANTAPVRASAPAGPGRTLCPRLGGIPLRARNTDQPGSWRFSRSPAPLFARPLANQTSRRLVWFLRKIRDAAQCPLKSTDGRSSPRGSPGAGWMERIAPRLSDPRVPRSPVCLLTPDRQKGPFYRGQQPPESEGLFHTGLSD